MLGIVDRLLIIYRSISNTLIFKFFKCSKCKHNKSNSIRCLHCEGGIDSNAFELKGID